MHGSVHPREVGAPQGPRVARDGVRKKQLLDHDIIIVGAYMMTIINLLLLLPYGVLFLLEVPHPDTRDLDT